MSLTKTSRAIWEGLARYCTEPEIDYDAFHDVAVLCLPPSEKQGLFRMFTLGVQDVFYEEAVMWRSPVKSLLVALAKGEMDVDLRFFVQEHLGHISTYLTKLPPEKSSTWSERDPAYTLMGLAKSSALGLLTRSKDYKDVADPIIDFIVTEMERLRIEEQEFPLILCGNCQKLLMPGNIGRKRYCGDCKHAAQNAKKSTQHKRHERWLYRLKQKKKHELREVLQRRSRTGRSNRERLVSLKKGFPELVREIEARAKDVLQS